MIKVQAVDRVDIRTNPQEVKLDPNILVLKNLWSNGAELIRFIDHADLWRPSPILSEETNRSEGSSNRISDHVYFTHGVKHPALAPFFRTVYGIFDLGYARYAAFNPYVTMKGDSGYSVLRYKSGGHYGAHIDLSNLGTEYCNRQVSAILYLNQSYMGGELHFPRQDITYKAQIGDLILFPSNFAYPHASLPITSGTKYCIVTWYIQ